MKLARFERKAKVGWIVAVDWIDSGADRRESWKEAAKEELALVRTYGRVERIEGETVWIASETCLNDEAGPGNYGLIWIPSVRKVTRLREAE